MWFLVCLFWLLFCFVWFALSLTGACPSVAIVFEPIAPCHSRSWGIIACLALMPHRPVFHLSCADFVSPVSPVSLAARGFCLVVVFLVLVFVFWPGCVVFWVWLVLGFLFPVSLCFFACLSSFTDWCTAHRQQFREQKTNDKHRIHFVAEHHCTWSARSSHLAQPHGQTSCCESIVQFPAVAFALSGTQLLVALAASIGESVQAKTHETIFDIQHTHGALHISLSLIPSPYSFKRDATSLLRCLRDVKKGGNQNSITCAERKINSRSTTTE